MNPKDDNELHKLLKASPKLTPPESFYRRVLEKIERKSGRAEERTPWYWGYPAKAFATVCVLMVIVLVTRDSKKPEPALLNEIKNESRPAPPSLAMARKDSWVQKKSDRSVERAPSAPAVEPAQIAFVMPVRETVRGAASQGSIRQSLVADRAQAGPISIAESPEDQGKTILQGALKKTLDMANHLSSKILPTKNPETAAPSDAGVTSSPKNVEWRGTTSGIDTPREVVVHHSQEWDALWNEHAKTTIPPPPVPAIDFTHNMVVGIFTGSKPSAGYSVGIAAVRMDTDHLTVIYYEMEPDPDRAYTAVMTQPHVMRVIPATDLPVVFLKAQ